MQYSLVFCESEFEMLISHLFGANPFSERAAYLLCRRSESREATRLLVREVHLIPVEDVESSSSVSMTIPSQSFLRVMKRASDTHQHFVFVHSHPPDRPEFSTQDNSEEIKLFRTAFNRIHGVDLHGSVVFSAPDRFSGRVWLSNATCAPIDGIRISGKRLVFLGTNTSDAPDWHKFDRQVRAFGPEVQAVLKALTVGVVGAGGTGSAVIEQLCRIGVGRILIADADRIQASNVTRVYGSSITDVPDLKVDVQSRHVERIGVGTLVEAIPKEVTHASVVERLKITDAIFCCTDDHWGRAVLNRFALYYLVPVFDLGVKIDSLNGSIRSVQGRVTILRPGAACLFCRQRISPEEIRTQSLRTLNPEEAGRLRREGYAPELIDPDPAVITFTAAIAASAVTELLHMLTGYMGSDRTATEVIHLFDQTRIRTNSTQSRPDCFCSDKGFWGRGDTMPRLDSTWRPE